MENIPEFAKTMTGSGISIALCGGGIWVAKTLGVTSTWLTIFGLSGSTLAALGAVSTTIQFYRYLLR